MAKILLAVDGTKRGLEAVSIMGRLLKDRGDLKIVLFHCVQQIATLLPEDLCTDIEENSRLTSEAQERMGQAVLNASLSRLTEAGFSEGDVEMRLKLDSADPAHDIINQADVERIRTIVVGRRGRSQVEALLLGTTSSKVAHYARGKTVWIVDAQVADSGKVLIAMEGAPEVRALSSYAAEMFGPCRGLSYTFLHIMPHVPPTLWDDGHILGAAEQEERQNRIERWRAEWTEGIERYMSEGRNLLLERGVGGGSVESLILPAKQGIARDLLTEIEAHRFQLVVMGKKSFHERKPFLMGSHAAKILQNAGGIILCLVS